MKVKELIESLKEFDQEMEVVLWTDHGQTCMAATCINETHVIDPSEFMMDEVHEDDFDEYGGKSELTEVLCISAP